MLKTDLTGRLEVPIVVDVKNCFAKKKNKNAICGIYKITSCKNKIYIGLSKDIESRLATYKNLRCPNQKVLLNSLIKYGLENHTFEIIHICKEEELNKIEIFYGKMFNVTDNRYGLNIKECGGSAGKLPEESLKKMSEAHKGEKNHFYGKKHTEESLKKMSDAAKNSVNPMLGKKHSDETKKKQSDIKKGRYMGEEGSFYGKKHTEESRDKISKKAIGRPSAFKGKNHSDENRKKISESLKGKEQSQETRDKRSKSLLSYHINKRKENGKSKRKKK